MSTVPEIIVVGGGIAGMTYATQLADRAGRRPVRIRILSKAVVQVSNSFQAQGGVAAVMRGDDSFEDHVRDTLVAGAGRNDEAVVRLVVREGPALIRGLIGLGAHFDRGTDGALRLAREGGHSTARVVHHRDRTGEEIVRVLQRRVELMPAIEVLSDQRAIDLIISGEGADRRCIGVRAVDLRTGDVTDRFAHLVVLATGGAGRMYEHTTNPQGASGDGIAMGIRAAALTRDMAFVQFHPTALHTGAHGTVSLVSEAVRGAGARLLGADLRPLMRGVHPMGDLAPRNVVARAIHREMMHAGVPHVWLDAGPIGVERFAQEFPGIALACRAHGLLPGRDLLPVMPAVHYMCGGLRTDDRGRTSIPGLFALGECAGSGVHGADRLASNSLLEALVIPKRAAEITWDEISGTPVLPSRIIRRDRLAKRPVEVVDRAMAALTHTMTKHVGIIRTEHGLQHSLRAINRISRQVQPIWERRRWTTALMDLRDLLVVARAVAEAALNEPESVGAHCWEVEPVS
ncbi:MAG: L-aspartate oxidase [Flavobacteriales bacterium]|nr:L-aspartate oxidase [Flavobacteriales bacterium]MCC6578312.1 L-aspartate oxidase [Flavobacteriales bacterium]NUQ15782.1 L-aspartate oxidase [Flavobacteriales bacterium]